LGTIDNTRELRRRESRENIAEVRKLNLNNGNNNIEYKFDEQLKRKCGQMEYRGRPYNCTKCKVESTYQMK
jgi:hypothetical protein